MTARDTVYCEVCDRLTARAQATMVERGLFHWPGQRGGWRRLAGAGSVAR